jgi:hypothetical protein
MGTGITGVGITAAIGVGITVTGGGATGIGDGVTITGTTGTGETPGQVDCQLRVTSNRVSSRLDRKGSL